MVDFSFCSYTEFVFGRGAEKKAGELLKKYGAKRTLIHYGGRSAEKSGLLSRVEESLSDAGMEYTTLGGVQPNPRLSLVRRLITLCREERIDFILAVGGGSVIDSAKAAAAGALYDGDVWDFFCGKAAFPKIAMPVGTVLTIPAAGSEGSDSMVITNEEEELKRGVSIQCIRPAFSLLNPELTFTLPAYQTACGIVDMMAHTMERYFTNERHVELTDTWCEGLLRTVIRNAPKVMENPCDYDARAEIMWAGAMAHNNVLGCGRVGDWASHQLEHELTGLYDVAHGAGLAVVMPAWMKYVLRHDVARFCQFAERVFDVQADYFDMEASAFEGVRRLEQFFTSIGMPTRLSGLSIGNDRLEEMARKVRLQPDGKVGNFVRLTPDDCLEIYRLAGDAKQ